MNRVIILEGPDGSGKTTLANTLATDHGFKVIHSGVPKETNGHDLFNTYLMDLWLALHEDQPVVFDRLYLGELIYGPIMRGRSLLTDHHQRMLDRVVMAYDIKHVLCLPPRPVAYDNWRAKKQDYVDHETKWGQVFEAYDRCCSTDDRYLVYDYTWPWGHQDDEGGYSVALNSLFIPRPTLPLGVVGSPRAKLLVVGEQVNAKIQEVDLPFMDDGGSSAFLDDCLKAGYLESEVAYCNAYNINGVPNRFERWAMRLKVPLPNVVALGKKAAKLLSQQGIPHTSLPHPQYVKRFQNGKKAEYAQQLKEVTCI